MGLHTLTLATHSYALLSDVIVMQYSDVIVTDCIHMKLVVKVASFLRLQDFQELQILKCIFFVTSPSFVPGFHSGFLYLCKIKSVLRPGKKAKANVTLKSTSHAPIGSSYYDLVLVLGPLPPHVRVWY